MSSARHAGPLGPGHHLRRSEAGPQVGTAADQGPKQRSAKFCMARAPAFLPRACGPAGLPSCWPLVQSLPPTAGCHVRASALAYPLGRSACHACLLAAGLPACRMCLPACVPSHKRAMHVCMLVRLPACLPSGVRACLLAHLLASLPAHERACLHACPTKSIFMLVRGLRETHPKSSKLDHAHALPQQRALRLEHASPDHPS